MDQKPIIPYSRIIGDDGAFDRARAEISEFEKFVLAKAEKLRGALSMADIGDSKKLGELAKELDEIKKAQLEVEKAYKNLTNVQKLYASATKDVIESDHEKVASLTAMEVEIVKLTKQLKTIADQERRNAKVDQDAITKKIDLQLRIKDLRAEQAKATKEVLNAGKATAQETKLQKAYNTILNNEVDTISEVRERMAALRLVVQNTSLSTEDGRKKIQAYNKEIDELTDLLKDNSDKFIQSKINIGNYTDSIKEALKDSQLFTTNIALLDKGLKLVVDALFRSKKATDQNTAATRANTKQVTILSKVQNFFTGIFKKNTAAVRVNTEAHNNNTQSIDGATDAIEENTDQTQENTQALERGAQSTSRLGKAFKGLGNVLKATGIALVVALLASIFAVFKQGRSGVIATDKAMAVFNVTIKVLIGTLADFGSALLKVFSGIGKSLGNVGNYFEKFALKAEIMLEKLKHPLGGASEEIDALEARVAALDKTIEENAANGVKERAEGWAAMGDAVTGFKDRLADAKKGITKDFEGIIRAFEIGDQIKKAEIEIIAAAGRLSKLQIRADDDTMSLRTQLEASKMAMQQRIKLMEKESQINALNLEMANAKAKTDVLANATSLQGVKGAQTLLALAEKKKLSAAEEVQFAQQLLKVNSSIDLRTSKNPLDDELLGESVEAVKVYKQGLNDMVTARLENAKQLRQIDRDIFEQNLDFLIDLIDTEKNLSEQIVNNTAESYDKRLEEFGRFVTKFRLNAQNELNEFNELAQRNVEGLKLDLLDKNNTAEDIKYIQDQINKLEGVKLRAEFDENNNLKVFNGDIELALDDTKKLNTQLQDLGLAEIPVNRFLEIARETRAWTKDTNELEKSLSKVKLKIDEIQKENIVTQDQTDAIKKLNAELSGIDYSKTTDRTRFEILKKLEKLCLFSHLLTCL